MLVTEKDGQPTVKVIDFGVAKALGEPLLASSDATREDHLVGTPRYMSPEQAVGDGVDTRSDVYALGVLLYELLTGGPPFEQGSNGRAKQADLLRAIEEESPQRPSQRVADAQRPRSGSTIPRALRRDLDWITLKTLEKASDERYQSASELADDLRRCLNGEAVRATPPTFIYRARKFVWRFRYSLAAAATVFTLVIAGAGAATWQAIRATQAEKESAIALARNQRVLDFLKATFGRPDPFVDGRDVTIVRVLEPALDDLLDSRGEMSKDPMERASLLIAISDALAGLGVHDRALEGIELAARIHTDQLGPMDPRTLATRNTFGSLLLTDRRLEEAISVLQDVIVRRTDVLGPWHKETLNSRALLASSYRFAGDLTEACQLAEEVLQLRRGHLGANHDNTISSMNSLGAIYRELGRWEEAVELNEEAVRIRTQNNGRRNHNTLVAMQNLASAYNDAQMDDKAVAQHETNLTLLKSIYADDHPMTLRTLNDLAGAYVSAGRVGDAVPIMEAVLDAQSQALGDDHPKTLINRNNLAWCYERAGRVAEAIPMYEEARRISEREHGPDHPNTLSFMSNLAWAYHLEGRYREAVVLNAETYAARAAKLGPDHPHTLLSLSRHAQDLSDMGLPNLAIPEFEFEIAKRSELEDQHGLAWAKQLLGRAYTAVGRAEEAVELLGDRRRQQAASIGSDHPDTLYTGRLVDSTVSANLRPVMMTMVSQRCEKISSVSVDGSKTIPMSWRISWTGWLVRPFRAASSTLPKNSCGKASPYTRSPGKSGQAKSQLGEVLFQQERMADAEPLLVEGYGLMTTLEHGAYPLKRLRAARRAEQFFTTIGDPQQVRSWQAKVREHQAEVNALHDLARSTLIIEGN